MLTITCDDKTAAAIVVDEVTEISIPSTDWVSAGCPTIGDTISFDAMGTGTAFSEALLGMQYLITDEFEHEGDHIISFLPADVAGDHIPDLPDPVEVREYADLYGEDALCGDGPSGLDATDLSAIPGIQGPRHYTPSLRLISTLVTDHGMTLKEIVRGVSALESARGPILNDEVVFEWLTAPTEDEDKPIDEGVVIETVDEATDDDDVIPIGETSDLPKMPNGDTSKMSRQ